MTVDVRIPETDFLARPSTAERFFRGPRAWKVLALLFCANLVNYFDRAAPGIVVEPLKAEFDLTDAGIGVLSGAFTLVYALFGLPLGRLADRVPRKKVMAWGIGAWSLLTAATGAAPTFATLLLARLGVGVGEASFAPAASSVIADLYPPRRRARAVGIFQLGLPLGLVLAFFTIGWITETFGSWRAAFLIAAVPGLVLAVGFALMREPERGASEDVRASAPTPVDRPFRRIAAVPTVWWLVLAGIGSNVASTSVNAFSVSLFQRWFGLTLTGASTLTGVVVGMTGLVGLVAGGIAGDLAGRRSPRRRVVVGAVALAASVPLTLAALLLGPGAVVGYSLLFGTGWLLQYAFFTTVFPALFDVVEPGLRSTAVALFLAALYVLGGSLGPILTGRLSDVFAGGDADTALASARGLRDAFLVVVPAGLAIGALGLAMASRTVGRDAARMLARIGADGAHSTGCPECAAAVGR